MNIIHNIAKRFIIWYISNYGPVVEYKDKVVRVFLKDFYDREVRSCIIELQRAEIKRMHGRGE